VSFSFSGSSFSFTLALVAAALLDAIPFSSFFLCAAGALGAAALETTGFGAAGFAATGFGAAFGTPALGARDVL
jgi:hypothetical protein